MEEYYKYSDQITYNYNLEPWRPPTKKAPNLHTIMQKRCQKNKPIIAHFRNWRPGANRVDLKPVAKPGAQPLRHRFNRFIRFIRHRFIRQILQGLQIPRRYLLEIITMVLMQAVTL